MSLLDGPAIPTLSARELDHRRSEFWFMTARYGSTSDGFGHATKTQAGTFRLSTPIGYRVCTPKSSSISRIPD